MQQPPAIQIDVPPHGTWRSCIAGLGMASGFCSLGWCLSSWREGQVGLAGLGLLLCGVAAALTWTAWQDASRTYGLNWNGKTWTLAAAGTALLQAPSVVALEVTVDLGGWMLICVTQSTPTRRSTPLGRLLPAQAKAWLVLSESTDPAAWHALRCALYGTGAGEVEGDAGGMAGSGVLTP